MAAAVRQGIAAARTHLERDGVVSVPRFTRPNRRRADPMALLGTGVQRVREALGAEFRPAASRPLWSRDQFALLSKDPAAVQTVTFAPAAVRAAIARGEPEGSAARGPVWTSGGRFAGTVRLTPLRDGTVETVRRITEGTAQRTENDGERAW
jgi:hypothetical protein